MASVAEIDRLWPGIAVNMEKACRRCDSELTAGELWQMCRSGGAFLCIVFDDSGIRMASVWRFEKKLDEAGPDDVPVFRCMMMYGSGMKEWLAEAFDYIKRIATDNGARRLVAEGRAGWLRVFKAEKHGLDYEVKI